MLDKNCGKQTENVNTDGSQAGDKQEDWTSVVGRHSMMMALEPRFMFDAAIAATVDAVTENMPDPAEAAKTSGDGEGDGYQDGEGGSGSDAESGFDAADGDDVGATGEHRAFEESARSRIYSLFNLDIGSRAGSDPSLSFGDDVDGENPVFETIINETTSLESLGLSVADSDGNVKVEITLTDGCKGELDLSGLGANQYNDIIKTNNATCIILEGSADKINEVFDLITFTGTKNATGSGDDIGSIVIKVFDEPGDATAAVEQSVSITINTVNVAPELTFNPGADGAISIPEDDAQQFVGLDDKNQSAPMFVITDGNLNDTLTVQVSLGNSTVQGQLVYDADGEWVGYKDGDLGGKLGVDKVGDKYTYTFTGSQAEVNDFLAGMRYQGAADKSGTDSITVAYWDATQGGEDNMPAAAVLEAQSKTVNVKVTPVNDVPILDDTVNPDTHLKVTVGEGGTIELGPEHFNIFDVDNIDEQLVITVEAYGGKGYLVLDVGGGNLVTLEAGDKFSYQQLIDGKISYVHSGGQVRPAGEEESGKFHNTDWFTFSVFDGSDGYYPGKGADNEWEGEFPKFEIKLTPVNQAPTVAVPPPEGVEVDPESTASTVEIFEGQTGLVIPIDIKDADQAKTGKYDIYLTLPENYEDGTLYVKDKTGVLTEVKWTDFTTELPDGSSSTAYQFSETVAAALAAKDSVLVFSHHGSDAYEHNDVRTGETRDLMFKIVVVDDGGGLGNAGRKSTAHDVVLDVKASNDLPELGKDLVIYEYDNPNGGKIPGVVGEIQVNDGWTAVKLEPDAFYKGGLSAFDKDSPDGNLTYTIASDVASGNLYYVTESGAYRALNSGDSFTQADLNAGRIVYQYNGTTGSSTVVDTLKVTITDSSKTAWHEDYHDGVKYEHQGFDAGYGKWDYADPDNPVFKLTEVAVVFEVYIPSKGPGFGYPSPPTFDMEIDGSKNNSSSVNEHGESLINDPILHFDTILKDGDFTVKRDGDNLVATDKYGFKIIFDTKTDSYSFEDASGDELVDLEMYNQMRGNLEFYRGLTLDGAGKDSFGNTVILNEHGIVEITTAGGNRVGIDQYELIFASGNTIKSESGRVITAEGKHGVIIGMDTTNADALTFTAENGAKITHDQYDILSSLTTYDYNSETGEITATYTKRDGNLVVDISLKANGDFAITVNTRDGENGEIPGACTLTAEQYQLLFKPGNDAYTWGGKIYAQDEHGYRITYDPATQQMTYTVDGKAVSAAEYQEARDDSLPINMGLYKDTMDSVDLAYRLEDPPDHGHIERWIPTNPNAENNGPASGQGSWVPVKQYDTFYQSEVTGGWVKYVHDGDEAFADEYFVSVSDGKKDSTVNDVKVSVVVAPANDTPTAGGGKEVEVREGWQTDAQQKQDDFPSLGVALDNTHFNIKDVDGNPVVSGTDSNGFGSKNSPTFVLTDPPEYGWILYYVGEKTTAADIAKDIEPENWVWLDPDKHFVGGSSSVTLADWAGYANAADVLTAAMGGQDATAVDKVLIFSMDDLDSGKIRYVHNGDDVNPNNPTTDPTEGGKRNPSFSDSFGFIVNDGMGIKADGSRADGVDDGVDTHESSLSEEKTVGVKVIPVNDKPLQDRVSGQYYADDNGDAQLCEFKTPEGGTSVPKGEDKYAEQYPDSKDLGTIITNEYLNYTDYDDKDEVIQYTIVTAPANGSLFRFDGEAWHEMSAGSTFTQAEINASLVKYVHNGTETHADKFTFTVSDSKSVIKGPGNSETGAGVEFKITVVPTNNKPVLDNHKEGEVIQDPDRLVYMDHNDAVAGDYVQDLFGVGKDGDKPIFEIKEDRDYNDGTNGYIQDEMQITLNAKVTGGPEDLIDKSWGTFGFADGDTNTANDVTTWTSEDGQHTVTVKTDETGKMVLVGKKDALNAALSVLTIKATEVTIDGGASTTDLNGSVEITCTVDDLGNGDGSAGNPKDNNKPYNLTDESSVLMYVNTINEQPVLTPGKTDGNNASVTGKEDNLFQIKFSDGSHVAIADNDALSREGTLTLEVTNGTLWLECTTGLEFVGCTNGSGKIVVKGTLDALNDALEQLYFKGNKDYNGPAALKVDYCDNSYIVTAEQGELGNSQAAAITIDIVVKAQNDAPTVVVPSETITIPKEGTYKQIDGVTVNDATDWATDPNQGWDASKVLGVTINATLDDTATGFGGLIVKGGANVTVTGIAAGANGEIPDGVYTVTKAGDVYTLAWVADGTVPNSGMYVQIGGSGEANLSVGGTAEVVNKVLEGLHYSKGTPGEGYDYANHSVNLKVTVDDQWNGTDNKKADGPDNNTATANITLVVSSVNTAPLITAPDTLGPVNEDGSLVVKDITIVDKDSPGSKFTVTFEVETGKGVLSISDSTLAGKITGGTANNSGTITLELTQAELDALLAGKLTFKPTANYNGDVALTITAKDDGQSIALDQTDKDPKTSSKTINIAVKPINDRPNITQPNSKPPEIPLGTGPFAENENAVAGVNVGDLLKPHYNDNTDNKVGDFDVSPGKDAADKGQLDMAGIVVVGNPATADQGSWQYLPSKPADFTGTDAEWAADDDNWKPIGEIPSGQGYFIPSDAVLRFVPNGDFNGTVPALTVRVVDSSAVDATNTPALSFKDGGDEDTGGLVDITGKYAQQQSRISKDEAKIVLSITGDANDAPVVVEGEVAMELGEDPKTNNGSTVSDLFGDTYKDPDNQTANGGTSADDFDGIIVVGVGDTDGGSWQYWDSTVNDWTDFPSNIDTDKGLFLDGDTKIRFEPDPDYNGPAPELTVHVVEKNDSTSTITVTRDVNGEIVNNIDLTGDGKTGGATRVSEDTVSVTLTVKAENDAPEINKEKDPTKDPVFANDSSTTIGWSINEDLLATPHDTEEQDNNGHSIGKLFNNDDPQEGDAVKHQIFNDDRDNQTGGTDSNGFAGVVIVGVNGADADKGNWEYSLDNGATWIKFSEWTGGTIGASNGLFLDAAALIRFDPADNYNGPAPTLTVHLVEQANGANPHLSGGKVTVGVDNFGGSSQYSKHAVVVAVDVKPINDAPTFSKTPTGPVEVEKTESGKGDVWSPVENIEIADADDYDKGAWNPGDENADKMQVTITAKDGDGLFGKLKVNASPDGLTGTVTVTDNGTATITISGSKSDINKVLETLEYCAGEIDGVSKTVTLDVVVNDFGNGQDLGDNTAYDETNENSRTDNTQVTLTVLGKNKAPVANVPTLTVDEDTGLSFTGDNKITITDAESVAGTEITVDVSVEHGTLTLPEGYIPAAGTVTEKPDGSLTIKGTQAQVNAILEDITYQPEADFNGTDTLTIKTTDDGSGIFLDGSNTPDPDKAVTDEKTFDITVNPINDAPTFSKEPAGPITVEKTESGQQDVYTKIENLEIADAKDYGTGDWNPVDKGSDKMQVTITAKYDDNGNPVGKLKVDGSAGTATVSQDGDALHTITITGSKDEINKILATLEYCAGEIEGATKTVNLDVVVNDFGNGQGLGDNAKYDENNTNRLTASTQVELVVLGENSAPVANVPTLTVDEDTGLSFTGDNKITITDLESVATTEITVDVSVEHGTLTLPEGYSPDAGAVTENADGSLTIKGTQAEVNAILEKVTYQPEADFNGTDTLTIRTTDDGSGIFIGGDGDADPDKEASVEKTFDITVNPVNDAPTFSKTPTGPITVEKTESGQQDVYTKIENLEIADAKDYGKGDWNPVDKDSDKIQVTITAKDGDGPFGKLKVDGDSAPGVTIIQDPDSPHTLILTGSKDDINTVLATLEYSSGEIEGPTKTVTLDVVVNDCGNGQDLGANTDYDENNTNKLTASTQVELVVLGKNSAPVAKVPTLTMDEDGSLALTGGNKITITDLESVAATEITADVSVEHGTLVLPEGYTPAGGSVVKNADGSLTVTGTQSEVNAILESITYRPDANFNGTDTLTIKTADDGSGIFIGGSDTADAGKAANGESAFAITVNRVNDAPTVIGGGGGAAPEIDLGKIAESDRYEEALESDPNSGVRENGGHKVGDLFKDPDDGDKYLYYDDGDDIRDENDFVLPENSETAMSGILVVNDPSGDKGTWQYKDGGAWVDFPADLGDGKALFIASDSEIRFVPAEGWAGDPGALDVRVVDSSGSHANGDVYNLVKGDSTLDVGGVTAVSSDTAKITIEVVAVNDAPKIDTGKVDEHGNPVYADGDNQVKVELSVNEDLMSGPESAPDANGGDTVRDLFGGFFDDSRDDVPDAGSAGGFHGIVIVDHEVNDAQGHWWYHDGTDWVEIAADIGKDGLFLAADAKLKFVPAEDYNGSAPSLHVHLMEEGGYSPVTGDTVNLGVGAKTGGSSQYSEHAIELAMTVNPVNDRPTLTTPGITDVEKTESGSADVYTPVTGIQISDKDYSKGSWTPGTEDAGDADVMQVTISANLKDGGKAPVGKFQVDGSGTGVTIVDNGSTIVLTGGKDEINLVLETLGYCAGNQENGTEVVISVAVEDFGNGQDLAGGQQYDENNPNSLDAAAEITVTVYGRNTPPTASVDPGVEFVGDEDDASISLGGEKAIVISDLEGGDGSRVTVEISAGHGDLSVGAGNIPGGVTVDVRDGKLVISGGTVNEVNEILKNLEYVPTGDFNGEDTLSVKVTDDGTGKYFGPKESSSNTYEFGVTVNRVNDAPTVTGGTGGEAPEIDLGKIAQDDRWGEVEDSDVNPNAGHKVGDLFENTYNDRKDVFDAKGGAVPDNPETSMSGILIVGDPSGSTGVWQYKNGDEWVDFPADLGDGNALFISTDTEIRFVPSEGWSGNPGALEVRVVDSSEVFGNGDTYNLVDADATLKVGGTSAVSESTAKIVINVVPVKEAQKPDDVTWIEPPPPTKPPESPDNSGSTPPETGLETPTDTATGSTTPGVNTDAPGQQVTGGPSQNDVHKELGTKPPTIGELLDPTENSAWPDDHELYGNTDEKLALLNVKQDFPLPEDLFIHSKRGERLEYTATLEDGSPLPDWMEFNPDDFAISATPPEGSEGSLVVLIRAEDTKGNRADATVVFKIGEENKRLADADADATDDSDDVAQNREEDGEPLEGEEHEAAAENASDVAENTEDAADGGDGAGKETVSEELLTTNEWLLREVQAAEEAEKNADREPGAKDADVHPGLQQQIAATGSTGLLAKARDLVDSLFLM